MKYPWMPLFWGDFLANTMHLSAHEAGAYLFLIAHAWENSGRIPVEPVRLARIAHVRQDQWKRTWKALENFFEPEALGPLMSGYTHQRVMDELHRLGKISSNRKAAAVQMHSKSSAPASTSTSTSNRESSFVRKEAQAACQSNGAWHPRIDDEHPRSAPYKSDNVLKPLPEKPRRS